MVNFFEKKTPVNFYVRGVFLFVFLLLANFFLGRFSKQFFLNENFAFSLPVPKTTMYFIYFFIVGALGIYLKQKPNFYIQQPVAWTLVFAGAASNILERLFFGYVRDYIFISLYGYTGIYNFADFYILLGAMLLVFFKKA